MRKYTDEQIIAAYEKTKNVWRAGELIGAPGQTVQRRLVAIGHPRSNRPYSDEDLHKIRLAYERNSLSGELNLKALAHELGRKHTCVCKQAKNMGLTKTVRKLSPERHEVLEAGKLAAFARNGHPRGNLGHKAGPETLAKISAASKNTWENRSEEERVAFGAKSCKARIEKGGTLPPRMGTTWTSGWREIGGKRHFFRSKWEMNYARWLEYRKASLKEILDWEYEPETFWFTEIKRGCVSYKPDFRVTLLDTTTYYDEVKGWMDDRSKTKLARMGRQFPHITVNVIDKKWFTSHAALQGVIPGWER